MWRSCLYISLVLCVTVNTQTQESRVVQTDQGSVRGYKESDRKLFAFYSIPYATVPTGRDRFKAPLPPPTWTEIFEATNKHIICLQEFPIPLNKQEDWLILDIFVPDTNQSNLPVMVSVHGGAYQLGYGAILDFKTFAETKNVIVVTFNYRLSTHGFLCLGTENVPGNAGMKDQVALLRWVNKNIASFGGNPNDVTIMGCSAGGSSVDLLKLSKITHNLFHKAIVESSSHLSAYSVQMDPIANAKKYAARLNFTNVDDIDALENFYLDTPWDILFSGTSNIFFKNTIVPFSPCIEKDVGQEMFLDDAPLNIILKAGKTIYPTIYGFTDYEGLLFLNAFYYWQNQMNENFSEFLPGDLEFKDDADRNEVARMVKGMYFGNLTINNDTVINYLDYYTDILFAYSMLRSTELQNEMGNNSSMFLHFYSFYDENTTPILNTNYRGAEHCAQMFIVADGNDANVTEEWSHMRSIMRDLYYNFITTGEPVVNNLPVISWPPVGANRTPYLSLGRVIELKNSLLEDRYRFWNDIYREHYRIPIPPTSPIIDSGISMSNPIVLLIIVNITFTLLCSWFICV